MSADTIRRALVLGLGASGLAAGRLLRVEGAAVTVLDRGDTAALRERAARLRDAGAEVLLGSDTLPEQPFDLAVISPGIAVDSPWPRALQGRGVPVIGELELGARRCSWPVLAVTGTNGKSTVVKCCAEALNAAGRPAAIAGNYGVPLSDVVANGGAWAWVVVEVSSFQLETVERFRPRVGVLLNLQPNHLDRHAGMRQYAACKARLFARMATGDVALVHAPAAQQMRRLSGAAGRGCAWRTFGLLPGTDYRYDRNQILFREGEAERSVPLAGSYFDNGVLGEGAAAAVGALRACGVEARVIAETFGSFTPLPHRMQRVAERGGVVFVDDSKATTLAALDAGVRMAGGPVRLIAGGRLKEHDLGGLEGTLRRRVRKAYLIGEAAGEMAAAWGVATPCVCCETLDRAVREAWREAEAGDVVLLAPGCASFDQFRNFEDRGNQFTSLARSLHEK